MEMFEPRVKIGENLGVYVDKTWKYLEIFYIEPMPPSYDLLKDFGSLATTISTSDTVVDMLEMESDEVGQFRFYPLDDIQIEVKQPKSITRFSNKNTRVRVDKYTQMFDPGMKTTELFVSEDDYPYFVVRNPTTVTLSESRVIFWGYRMVGKVMEERPDRVALVVGQGY